MSAKSNPFLDATVQHTNQFWICGVRKNMYSLVRGQFVRDPLFFRIHALFTRLLWHIYMRTGEKAILLALLRTSFRQCVFAMQVWIFALYGATVLCAELIASSNWYAPMQSLKTYITLPAGLHLCGLSYIVLWGLLLLCVYGRT